MTEKLDVWKPLLQFVSGKISYNKALSQISDNLDSVKNRCVEAYVNNETILFENGNRIVILPAGERHYRKTHNFVTPIANSDGTVDYCWDEEFLGEVLAPITDIKDNSIEE